MISSPSGSGFTANLFADDALDGHTSAVGFGDVLDDGQAKTGAAKLPAPGLVHAIEPLE